jgi:hypothetical protein
MFNLRNHSPSTRKTLVVAALAGLAAIATASSARADVYCSGALLEHLVYADGQLMIRSQWRNDWTVLCSVTGTWKGVPTETCFTWFGLLTSAKTNNKPVGIYYTGDTPCSALGTYASAPAPIYVRMGE